MKKPLLIGLGILCVLAIISSAANDDALPPTAQEAPVATTAAYSFTASQVREIDANINRNLQPEFSPLEPEELKVICRNYEKAGWDLDGVMEDLRQNGASKRSEFAHQELLVWLWDATATSEDPLALTAGYCAHKR